MPAPVPPPPSGPDETVVIGIELLRLALAGLLPSAPDVQAWLDRIEARPAPRQ